jgi:hypothetical protein
MLQAQLITATSPSGLQTALDAFLATLTDPLIQNLHLCVASSPRRQQEQYIATLVYQNGTGPTLANPFTVQLLTNPRADTLQATFAAEVAAAPAELFAIIATGAFAGNGIGQRYLLVVRNALAAAIANLDLNP